MHNLMSKVYYLALKILVSLQHWINRQSADSFNSDQIVRKILLNLDSDINTTERERERKFFLNITWNRRQYNMCFEEKSIYHFTECHTEKSYRNKRMEEKRDWIKQCFFYFYFSISPRSSISKNVKININNFLAFRIFSA